MYKYIDCQVAAGAGKESKVERQDGEWAQGEVVILDQVAGKSLTEMVTQGEELHRLKESGEGHCRQTE